ncbi:MAG: tRNA dihydrouridine synthase DusB [Chromatiales bacterium]|nr:tRNA dihydrouridine synthase DusB [Gammaproteobacteria bacterium]MCP5352172.1 tRNA dihydrouridine synthase DusB [Chromatiales bacterium]
MQIGPYVFDNNVALAPMAGITDLPFRTLCRELGVGWTVSEMVTSRPDLRASRKTQLRLRHGDGGIGPRIVQIVGADPDLLADAARFNVEQGADIIDINMGCPAKKVCNVASGSALLRDEALVASILEAVVAAVDVPVTLKTRTGWDHETRNAVGIARVAEAAGIQALTLHGRTRADRFTGEAEYDTIAEVKATVSIPVIANGDIDSAAKAHAVLAATGADAVMIGRAAQGRPWLPGQIARELPGIATTAPDIAAIHALMHRHLDDMHAFYGEHQGVRIARKHIGWYLDALPLAVANDQRQHINRAVTGAEQLARVDALFNHESFADAATTAPTTQEAMAA